MCMNCSKARLSSSGKPASKKSTGRSSYTSKKSSSGMTNPFGKPKITFGKR